MKTNKIWNSAVGTVKKSTDADCAEWFFKNTGPRSRPNNDFLAALESGLGRIAFVHKKFPDAERWYHDVVTGELVETGES
jgi:hypothetical protein